MLMGSSELGHFSLREKIERVGATGIVREAGSLIAIPADEFRALLGSELVFGDLVLETLFRRRKAIEQFRLGIHMIGSRFDPDFDHRRVRRSHCSSDSR